MPAIITDWKENDADKTWSDSTHLLEHNLPSNPLFNLDTLGHLIEKLPRENYMLMHTGPVGTAKKLWEEGEIGDLSGKQVIDSIKNGNLWLLIRQVDAVSAPMASLMTDIYNEFDTNIAGGYSTFNHLSDILISSPSAQVYYHCDRNGQTLWQVHGRKRVYVYPNRVPFLTEQMLEYMALYEDETAVKYDPDFDQSAAVYELKAGQMLHWPLFSPHRVENLEFSVSYTTQYYTPHIKRLARTQAANGVIHSLFPRKRLSTSPRGASYAAKSLLQVGARRLGMFDRLRQSKRRTTFRLDPHSPGNIIPIKQQS